MLVRPARPSDAEPLVPVFADWSHALGAGAIAERLGAWADEPRAGVLAAELDEELARGWGCDRLELTSSRWREEAPRFYEALGYAELSGRQARYSRDL